MVILCICVHISPTEGLFCSLFASLLETVIDSETITLMTFI